MNKSAIPWTDLTWNPVTGCTFGCEWCYARKVAARFRFLEDPEEEYPYSRDNFKPTTWPGRLNDPLRRKKPSIIFVCSMGDLFDPAVPDEFRDRVFAIIHEAKQHTFIVLTKRATAMRDYFKGARWRDVLNATGDAAQPSEWPLPNLWLGVSVTNQADADARIPILLDTPAAHRMVSVEPMLGPVDLERYEMGEDADFRDYLDFVAVGAKTPGPALHENAKCKMAHPHGTCLTAVARCNSDCPRFDGRGGWLRNLLDQCEAAGVPVNYKHGNSCPAVDGKVYAARPGEAS